MRTYHFVMKFLRSFGIGFSIGSAVSVVLLAVGYAVLQRYMG